MTKVVETRLVAGLVGTTHLGVFPEPLECVLQRP